MAYEIATIGNVRAPGGVARMGDAQDLSSVPAFLTTPVLIGAGVGAVVGLLLGAFLFGGGRRG